VWIATGNVQRMVPTVRIEQPIANRVSMLLIIAGASFGLFTLLGQPTSPLFVLFILGLAGLWAFGYRTIRITASADRAGIEIRNLLATERAAWAQIDRVTVEPSKSGGGSGIVVKRSDGVLIAVEASWGPWYQGRSRFAVTNAKRCAVLVTQIEALRGSVDGEESAGPTESP